MKSEEFKRVHSDKDDPNLSWYKFGPYLSEREWGTVREDYSAEADPGKYLTHDDSRSRAYRWGEDGLGGISDEKCLLCFAFALWNGKDPILKERLFGLNNSEGNHGEDVKEYYFYLDSTPTHSYMRFLYRYPQAEYPYNDLVLSNRERTLTDREYELLDTGIFDENRYFDFYVEYAKVDPDDIVIMVSIVNRGPERASITVLPQVWFRNTWSWEPIVKKPQISVFDTNTLKIDHPRLDPRWFYFEGGDEFVFTENNTNKMKLFGTPNASSYVKDAFHEYIVHGDKNAVNPDHVGTKAAKVYRLTLDPGETSVIRIRTGNRHNPYPFLRDFDEMIEQRHQEADEYYDEVSPGLDSESKLIQRRAFAGLMWSKQYYRYQMYKWLGGDPTQPRPPQSRLSGRNHQWRHFAAREVLSMPDKWEYPYFCAWDMAFHCVAYALADPDFAKQQLSLLFKEWYTHPNGQVPAYEWAFGDVNPPVHAWAALRVYQIEQKHTGKKGDRKFLASIFHKLLLNFTWWVNRKDKLGHNIFEGGFLGLDNISVIDRSRELETGMRLEQSDGTSWMAMYCLNMLAIALELAKEDSTYDGLVSKFFEHFIYIATAMNAYGEKDLGLWDEEDGIYYDVIKHDEGKIQRLKVRSLVGLMPLFAVATIDLTPEVRKKYIEAMKRIDWYIDQRPDLAKNVEMRFAAGPGQLLLLSLVPRNRVERLLAKMLDEKEFLSDYGLRSVSKYHQEYPFNVELGGVIQSIHYEPGESTTRMFGGNSNWRGPIWFPINFLLIEAIQKLHYYYGNHFLVPFPTGSDNMLNLWEVSLELENRLLSIFKLNKEGKRPVYGGGGKFQEDPLWRSQLLFYEYFHGDTGEGLGASHQTGWTALVAKMIDQTRQRKEPEKRIRIRAQPGDRLEP